MNWSLGQDVPSPNYIEEKLPVPCRKNVVDVCTKNNWLGQCVRTILGYLKFLNSKIAVIYQSKQQMNVYLITQQATSFKAMDTGANFSQKPLCKSVPGIWSVRRISPPCILYSKEVFKTSVWAAFIINNDNIVYWLMWVTVVEHHCPDWLRFTVDIIITQLTARQPVCRWWQAHYISPDSLSCVQSSASTMCVWACVCLCAN